MMSESFKLELKNEKNSTIPLKRQNNVKHDSNFQITDNFKNDRVRFENNGLTVIVPTHRYHKISNKYDNKDISAILTINDTKMDLTKQMKNDTKCKRKVDPKHLPTHSTLSKAESKTSLKSDHKIVLNPDGKPILRSVESKSDLKSLTGSLPRRESTGTVKSYSVNRTLHKVDSKATLKSDTISIIGASSSGSAHAKKSLESMTDEEIIEENLKELLESKNREERKANGRLIAVIVTFLVIFIAFYNTWLKNAKNLAAILMPVLIMISYGGWVVLLAKRDKQRQVLFAKHLEEVMERNKIELAQKAKLIRKKKMEEAKLKEDEKAAKEQQRLTKRPSFREKLFGTRTPTIQPSTNLLNIAVTAAAPSQIVVDSKKKRLERMNALVLPHPPVRTGSVS
ncbi:uncharacterized protein [Eurosta solidaginis]|uniref:uncharacterized protein n=1 Tax=Eurosta solidaginis TaxID=178769 RepID=UPI00353120E2